MSYATGQLLYRAGSYNGVYVSYVEFVVIKVTPQGGWILERGDHDYVESMTERFPDTDYTDWVKQRRRWVSFDSRKRYAYPTKDEALNSLKARAFHHLAHCKRRLQRAQERYDNLHGNEVRETPALSLMPIKWIGP
jgi:hypothetical protein